MEAYLRCVLGLCLAAMLGACGGVPDCGDSDTIKTAMSIVKQELANANKAKHPDAGLAMLNDMDHSVEHIRTLAHDESVDKYTCQGQMTLGGNGEYPKLTGPIVFSVEPLEDGGFWVETESPREWFNDNGGDNTMLAYPLFAMAREGNAEIVEFLLDAGAKDDDALPTAARNDHAEIVELLLDAGADANAKHDGATVVFHAAGKGNAEIVELLLDAGAKDDDALWAAAIRGHAEIFEMLLDAGADMNVRFSSDTLLGRMAREGNAEFVELLLDAGATDDDALPAAARNHAEIVELLLDAGADVNARDRTRDTALSNAALRDHPEIVKMLLDAGAMDNDALPNAAANGHAEIVKLLLDAGADVNAKDKDGHTALYAAGTMSHHPEIVKMLREAGATR